MSGQHESNKEVDTIQASVAEYACGLAYAQLPLAVVQAAKVRTLNTLAGLFAGYFSEPARILRDVAASMPSRGGATLLGTRRKTTPDMAAFVNTTAAAYMEMSDTYHVPGTYHGHPSDVVLAVWAAAEHAHASGREFITALVVAYQVYLRLSDNFHNQGFDYTQFGCIGSAAAAGKLFGLAPHAMAHCIAMAAVPNVILRQVRMGQLSMYRAGASGHAARAGVFAALLARAGMEGPHLPFVGKAGWCDHVARERFALAPMRGDAAFYRILDTRIKNRISCGEAIASILAAEKIAPLRDVGNVQRITVEVYKYALERAGSGEHRMNPQSRETADHSIPYVVAATLIDGTITPRSYSDSRLWNADFRTLMGKVTVVENPEYTRAFDQVPVQHRTRVTVVYGSGETLVGAAGGDDDDLAEQLGDEQIAERFRALVGDMLGTARVGLLIAQLRDLENVQDMAELAPVFAMD